MKNFHTFAWAGLAIITFIGGLASISPMAGTEDGLMAGLAMRGLYLVTIPLTLITTGFIYRFMLKQTDSTGIGIVGAIHFALAFLGTLVFIGAWYYQSLAMSGSSQNFELMGLMFGVSGAFSLLSAIFFLIAVLIALNSRPKEELANTYS